MTFFKNRKRFTLLTIILTVLALFFTIGLTGCAEKEFVGFTYTLNDSGKGYIFGCDGTYKSNELIVPAEHEGLPIVEIKKSAFKGNKYLQSVVFETEDALTINKKAFKNCTSLSTVTFKGKCTVSVLEDGFYMCPLKVLNAGCAELTSWESQFADTGFSVINIEGGNVVSAAPTADGGTVTVSNGSRFQYGSKKYMNELTVTDDLFMSGTSLRHTYTTGVFTSVEHHAPVALKINLPQTLTHIPAYFFGNEGDSCTVYYAGSKVDWDKVTISSEGNDNYTNGNINMVYREDMSFTVSFKDVSGAEIAAARTLKYGSKLTDATPPAREGYTFMGWYKDDKFSEKWDSDTDTVTGNITLYAGYLDDNHVHNYTEEVIAPTCTEQGYTIYTCECILGNKIDAFVDALGHSYNFDGIVWSWAEDYTATATVECNVENCPQNSHEHIKTFTANITEDTVKQADCKEEGKAVYTASISYGGQAYTASETKEKSLPTVSHTPVSDGNAVEPTCTQTGLTASTHCGVCNDKLSEQQTVEKLPHTPVSDGNAVEPTCTQTGLTASTSCRVCHTMLTEQQPVEKISHTPVSDDNAVAPTCTQMGLTASTSCRVCHTMLTEQQPVEKIPHTPVSDDNAVAPTCTATGLTASTHCGVCGQKLTDRETVAKLEHSVVIDVAVAATCTQTGLTEGSHCGVCGTVIKGQQLTEIIAHTDNDGDYFCDVCLSFDTTGATEINSVAGLRNIVNNLTGRYYITADISLSGEDWLPLGTSTTPFAGVLYGGGCTISGLSLTNVNIGGLFAYNSGTIHSLKIKDFTLAYNKGSVEGTRVMGGIAAYNDNKIINCTIEGANTVRGNCGFDVSVSGSSAYNKTCNYTTVMGGIAAINNASITGCSIIGSITVSFETNTSYDHSVGVLYIQGTSDFARSNSTVYFGGIAGRNAGTIEDCEISGTSTAAVRSVVNLNHNNLHIGQCYSNTTAYIGSITGENKGTVTGVIAKATVISTSTSGSYTNDAYKIATPYVNAVTDGTYKGLIGSQSGKIDKVNFN